MIYRPRPEITMWDTWMLKQDETLHLFTLSRLKGLKYWDRVCHAVSGDWIHWEDWEDIILEEKENKDAWDAGVILTGSAFKCDRGYGMTYGAVQHEGRVQRIGVAFSNDLHTWEKFPGNPVLVPTGPYYEDDPDGTTENSVAWRDAYVIPVEGGYEAFIAANDASGTKTVNACVAHVASKDLAQWEYLPPIASPARYVDMEVPQYFEWNGYHYLLFSTGTGVDTPSRVGATGTYYLVAKSKGGPYRVPQEALLIGSGEGRADCYVGKVIFTDSGPLLYHHITGKRTAFAAPKAVRQDSDGKLSLQRWPGLDELRGDAILSPDSPGAVVNGRNGIPIGHWRIENERLIGDGGPAMSGWLFEKPAEDCAISATLDLSDCERTGVLFRIAPVEKPRPGIGGLALCVNRRRGVIQLCEAEVESRRSVQLKPLDNVHLGVGESFQVEVFLRAEYVEIYGDGRPLFVLNAGDYPAAGKVGFFVDSGKVVLSDIAVRNLPPMPS